MPQARYQIADLLRVMQRLRDPDTGCPWDLRQDFKSIVPSTLEECYELAEAIEQGDLPHVAEELGDVLFQVVFYARLGEELDQFSFASVVDQLTEKLIRRHPHVFADADIEGVVDTQSTEDAVKESWESIKQAERESKSLGGALADVPVALPALPRAQKLQKRAARASFDWPDSHSVMLKLDEEIAELRDAISQQAHEDIEAEMGDLLFTCVNLARHLGVDAEASLRRSSSRFERRFNEMETRVLADGKRLDQLGAIELDRVWESVKATLG